MFGFPGSSAGEESACNAGDSCLILGLGRSAGEGIGKKFSDLLTAENQSEKNCHRILELKKT